MNWNLCFFKRCVMSVFRLVRSIEMPLRQTIVPTKSGESVGGRYQRNVLGWRLVGWCRCRRTSYGMCEPSDNIRQSLEPVGIFKAGPLEFLEPKSVPSPLFLLLQLPLCQSCPPFTQKYNSAPVFLTVSSKLLAYIRC